MLPLSVVEPMDSDDCAVDGTTPGEEEECYLLFLFGGVFYLKPYVNFVCHVCLNWIDLTWTLINIYSTFTFEFILSQLDLSMSFHVYRIIIPRLCLNFSFNT